MCLVCYHGYISQFMLCPQVQGAEGPIGATGIKGDFGAPVSCHTYKVLS